MSLYAADLLNALPGIEDRTYLELGIDDSGNFRTFGRVRARVKYGVDCVPRPLVTHWMTTDAFFAGPAAALAPFDIVFVDANHQLEFVVRDFNNAVRLLSPRGIILAHDLVPPTPAHVDPGLCGTGYQFLHHVAVFDAMPFWTLNADCGLTVFPQPLPLPVERLRPVDYAEFMPVIEPRRVRLPELFARMCALP